MCALLLLSFVFAQGPDIKVPWEGSTGPSNKKLLDILTLYGLGPKTLEQIKHRAKFNQDEMVALWRMVERLPTLRSLLIERSVKKTPSFAELVDQADTFVGQVHQISGKVISVTQRDVPKQHEISKSLKRYFEVRVRLRANEEVTIVTRGIPKHFLSHAPEGQAVSSHGLFFKSVLKTDGKAEPLFVAHRFHWLPTQADSAANINKDMVVLSSLGFDASLLDHMKSRNRTKGIGPTERECFYQLLSRINQASARKPIKAAASDPNLGTILLKPKSQQGRVMRFTGTLRRITKVVVDEPDIQQRFGIKHYYQLDVFIPLGKQTIRLGVREGDPVIRNQFPMTFCITDIPDELKKINAKSRATRAKSLNEQVQINAVFFKLWKFDSSFMEKFAKKRADGTKPSQVGPLFIGSNLVHIPRPPAQNNWVTSWIIGGSGAIVLLVVSLLLFRASKRDKEVDRKLSRQRFEIEDSESLNDLDVQED